MINKDQSVVHKFGNKFYELNREIFEGENGTVSEPGLGTDLGKFIDVLTQLKNDGFKNIYFGSDDPYCGVEISVSKLEKGIK